MFQVGAGKGIGLHLGDAAGVHVPAQQGAHDQTDSGFALAALTSDNEHLLSLGGGDETVAQVLLECQDVVRLQQIVQKRQPLYGLGRVRYVIDWQAVDTKLLFLCKSTVKEQRAVGNVYPVLVDRQGRGPTLHP